MKMQLKTIFSTFLYVNGLVILLLLTGCSSCSNYTVSVQDSNEDTISNNTTKPILNVYIENSGSMDGFVLERSQFKDDLYEYISKLNNNCAKLNLNYINSQVIPIQEPLEYFFTNLTTASFKAKGGNRAHSDIVDMMKDMLRRNTQNSVTLFASDCILDLQGNTNAFLGLKKTTLADVIHQYRTTHPDFGFRVLCLQSDFNGFLYPANSSPLKVSGKRPYYIWMFGSNRLLGNLLKEVSDDAFGGDLTHSISFSDVTKIPNNIGKTKGAMSKDGSVTLKKSNAKFDLYLNLTSTLLDEDTIENVKKYAFPQVLQLDGVEKINFSGSKYSHILHFSLERASRASDVQVSIKKTALPKWVNEINDNTGYGIKTTCGIKYLIEGIKEAFDDVPQPTVNLEISKQ